MTVHRKKFESIDKELKYFLPKQLLPISQKYGLVIWDPGKPIRIKDYKKHLIPDLDPPQLLKISFLGTLKILLCMFVLKEKVFQTS
jgi:hypothetical protein